MPCIDIDEDGFNSSGGTCGVIDCDDNNSAIYPGAPDLCDGIDNDCNALTMDGNDESWYADLCDGADSDLCEEGIYECSVGVQTCTDLSFEHLRSLRRCR